MLSFFQRLALAWRILFLKSSNLLTHAADELAYVRKSNARVGVIEQDTMQDDADRCVLELVACFCTQGHSGMSAGYIAARLQELLMYKPLSPLTGRAEEWVEVTKGLWQNRRCGSVFKDDEKAWDIDAIVFRRPDGITYTSGSSRAYIQFPYIQKKRFIEVAH